jgi:predicted phosphohydrolase
MPRITYVSDIHLEFINKTPPYHTRIGWEKGDILCLAGDIGYPEQETYHTFMAYCSISFEFIFVIAGNHEYYTSDKNKTIQRTNEKIEQICSSFPNVHFLNNTTYYIKKYDMYILGTTLWTETTDDPEERFYYHDFRQIPQMGITGYMDLLHTQSVGYLINELETRTPSKVIVMTHHMPSFELIDPKYKGGSLNHLFASNLNYLFKKYTIDHWICGHSHVAVEKTIGRTQIHMNPIGYPGENTPNWKASFDA